MQEYLQLDSIFPSKNHSNISIESGIEKSNTDSSIRNELLSSINLSKDIIKKVKNNDLKDKFNNEYSELLTEIDKALSSNNDITKSELNKLKNEFSDIINLANNNKIDTYNLQFKDNKSFFIDKNFLNNYNQSIGIINSSNFNLDSVKDFLENNKNAWSILLDTDPNKNIKLCFFGVPTNYDKLISFSKELKYKEEIKSFKEKYFSNITEKFKGNYMLAKKLIDTLNKKLTKGSCLFDKVGVINEFLLKNKTELIKSGVGELSHDDLIEISNIKKEYDSNLVKSSLKFINTATSISAAGVIRVNSVIINGEEYNEEDLNNKKETLIREGVVVDNLNNGNIDYIISSGKRGESNEQIMTRLVEENKELEKALVKYEIQRQKRETEREKQKLEEEQRLKEEQQAKEEADRIAEEELESELNFETKYIKLGEDKEIAYIENAGEVVIDNNTSEGLIITSDELNKIIENPEKANNLIDFHKTLIDLKLGFIWNFRERIGNIVGGDTNINYLDQDGIKGGELLKILNAVLALQKINPVSNLETAKMTIKQRNKKLEASKIGSMTPIESYLWKEEILIECGFDEEKAGKRLNEYNK